MKHEHKWKWVAKELPSDNITVLCCNAERGHYWLGYLEGMQFWCNFTGENIPVTHWQHLPETPKGKAVTA